MVEKIAKPGRRSALLLSLISLYSVFFAYNHLATTEWGATSFRSLVDGTSITPMQYRVLVPWIARGLERLMPVLPFVDDLYDIRALLEFISVFSLLWIFVWATRRLLDSSLPGMQGARREAAVWLALVLLMLALPFHFLTQRTQPSYYYPSDIPGITVFVIGLVAALRRRYLLFYLVFIIGTLNRETTCFLTIFFLIVAWQGGARRNLLIHAAAQAALWIGIKVGLHTLYAANTVPEYCDICGIFKYSVAYNVDFSTVAGWFGLASVYGFLWIPLLAVYRRIPNQELRRGLWVVPIFHAVMFVPGEIYELRIYMEMLPLVVWGVALGVLSVLGTGDGDLPQSEPNPHRP
jgi:hypothetical protein